ncbi:MAG: helix-turn-helix domain-containing protein [Promethearchaeota archaeon]
MKAELEDLDIEIIAQRIVELLKPHLNTNCITDDVTFDVQGLSEYLKASKKWIYERTHLKEIPHVKINGLLRFRKRHIERWLNQYNVPAIETPGRIFRAIKRKEHLF